MGTVGASSAAPSGCRVLGKRLVGVGGGNLPSEGQAWCRIGGGLHPAAWVTKWMPRDRMLMAMLRGHARTAGYKYNTAVCLLTHALFPLAKTCNCSVPVGFSLARRIQ